MQDWYEFYGLDRDPFAEGGMYGLFYPGGARQEMVEQLLHLARFSDSSLLICGAAGAGKTATLRHFVAQSASDTRYCVVEAALLDSPERLLGRILGGFDIEFPAGVTLDDGLARLEEFVVARHAQGLLSWIVLDDAQHLHADALVLLPRLLQHTGSSARLILFAESQWQQTLQQALPEAAQLHVLELAPFDRGESYAYIHYRLKTAGLEVEPPFNAGEFEEIHRQSAGLPGRINTLARKVLTDAVVEVEQPLSTLPLWHFGVVAATLLALLLLYMWGSLDEESPSHPTPRAGVVERGAAELMEPASIEPGEIAGDAVLAPSTVVADVIDTRDATKQQPLRASADGDEPAVEAATLDAPSVAQTTGSLAAAQPDDATEVSPDNIVTGQQVPVVPVVTAAEPPRPAVAEKSFVYRDGARAGGELTADEKYLLGLDAAHYLIQIMGSDDEAKVRAFAARQSVTLRQFRKLNNGAEWFALVHGDFSDRARAERTLEELPESLRRARPWVRRADTVQAEIRQALIP
ncbi:MAG: AAA family ATPase [Pseudomonadales bacterium]|nr:AAA family ATPase [Pseudomonadales bacterium]